MEPVDCRSSPGAKIALFRSLLEGATTSIRAASKAGEQGNPDMLLRAGTSGSPAFARNRELSAQIARTAGS
jgi:hypothetical protein